MLFVAALLVALALWLTRDTAAHLVFDISSRDAVTGLQPQANVRFKGVNVGKVASIGFDPQVRGNVLVRIYTNADVPVSKFTYATLGFQGVTGLGFVQLDNSAESTEILATSDEQPARIPMRASLFSKLADQGASILIQVEETSRRLNQLLAPDNQKTLFAAVHDIGQSAGKFGQAATSLQQFSSNASRILDFQFGPEKMNLPKLVDDMEATLKSLQATSHSVGASADEFKSTATELKLQDYRDEASQYDGIASIEMFEAVGEAYWPSYFACIARNLKNGGKACVQSIVIQDALFERYRMGTDFIQRYIFPGGQLPCNSEITRQVALHTDMQLVDLKDITCSR